MTKEEAQKLTQEQAEVMLAFVQGEKIEIAFKGRHDYSTCQIPRWDWAAFNYRIARQIPSINWDHVHAKFKWLVVNLNGVGILYSERPIYIKDAWGSGGKSAFASFLSSYSGPEKGGEWAIAQRPE